MQYLIKSFKKTISDNLYDFIIVDCNNNSLRSLNEFYCHSKDSGFMVSILRVTDGKLCWDNEMLMKFIYYALLFVFLHLFSLAVYSRFDLRLGDLSESQYS